jgi:CRP-like cAMP-binding protein
MSPAATVTCHAVCLPSGLAGVELQQVEDVVRERRTVKRGQLLYQQGDPFQSLFALKSGSMKSTVQRDGMSHMLAFALPSELIPLAFTAHFTQLAAAMPVYSEKMPSSTWRCAPAKPARPSAAITNCGAMQVSIVSQ